MSWRIRAQADDFLNAYKELEKSGAAMTSPMVVCLAFAIELYFKELYHVLGKKAPGGKDGHNILKLFDKLPEPTQQQIFAHASISQIPVMTMGSLLSPHIFSSSYSAYDRFRDQIEAISEAYVKWRYAYESSALRYESSFALALIEAVRSTADHTRSRSNNPMAAELSK